VGPGRKPECGMCGAKLPAGAARCHVCGAPIHPEHQQRRCPNCGTPAAQRAKTCLMCDAPLDRVSLRGGRANTSWPWLVAVALVVVLVVVGLNYWRNQSPSASAVPSATPSATYTPRPARIAMPSATPTQTPPPAPSPTPIIHEVQSGETVSYIASYYGTTIDGILEANGLDENTARMLRPGQALVIPSIGPVGGPLPGGRAQPIQVIHEVKSGETLISIAIDYDTTVDAILNANDLASRDLIYVGQQLIVPIMPASATATITPTATTSSTPGPPYAAPELLSPSDGAVFRGEDALIMLTWASVGILREDQVYLIEVETPAQITPITYSTQGTSWRLPGELRPTGRRRGITWRVTVVRRPNPGSTEPLEWEPISLPSDTRHFVWW
jgi:LysM repeat protein